MLIRIALTFVPKDPIDNDPALVQYIYIYIHIYNGLAEQTTNHYLNQ